MKMESLKFKNESGIQQNSRVTVEFINIWRRISGAKWISSKVKLESAGHQNSQWQKPTVSKFKVKSGIHKNSRMGMDFTIYVQKGSSRTKPEFIKT